VATHLPAIREYAGDVACFIEKNDVGAAVEQLLQLCKDKTQREELGLKARHRITNHFSWGKIAQIYTKLYADFLF
jgi:glycosyltransferase involved in cell wall biosynthesis